MKKLFTLLLLMSSFYASAQTSAKKPFITLGNENYMFVGTQGVDSIFLSDNGSATVRYTATEKIISLEYHYGSQTDKTVIVQPLVRFKD